MFCFYLQNNQTFIYNISIYFTNIILAVSILTNWCKLTENNDFYMNSKKVMLHSFIVVSFLIWTPTFATTKNIDADCYPWFLCTLCISFSLSWVCFHPHWRGKHSTDTLKPEIWGIIHLQFEAILRRTDECWVPAPFQGLLEINDFRQVGRNERNNPDCVRKDITLTHPRADS